MGYIQKLHCQKFYQRAAVLPAISCFAQQIIYLAFEPEIVESSSDECWIPKVVNVPALSILMDFL